MPEPKDPKKVQDELNAKSRRELEQTFDSVPAPLDEPNSSDLPSDVTTEFSTEGGSSGSTNPSTVSFKKESVSKLIGGYQLGEKLGEGGMGRVYKAIDSDGRAVAIKLLSPRWATSSDALLRFKQEGFIASQINHPHCVFVHRVDEEQGIPYIAMELMSGQTLKDLVLRRGPLPYEEAIQLILQCIDGLIETHSKGMIHRDIKPANCYLDDQGNVKIGDFGLARSLVDDSELTRTGAFLGTPLFASPEQVLGQSIDTQSDIYSLSATLYYLLAGRAPFESPNAAQVIAKIASAEPPPFREIEIDVPRTVENIVLKGLSRDKNQRFDSFEKMRAALLPIIAPQDDVASLARRSAASIIDMIILSFFNAFALFLFYRPSQVDDLHPFFLTSWGAAVYFIYLWPQEYIFGSTIGKRLFRLRVTDQDAGGRQRAWLLVVRTASYIMILNAGEFLCHLIFLKISPFALPLIGWVSQLLGCLILLIAWWRTGGRQLTHEWLSRTETRLITHKHHEAHFHLEQLHWSPRLALVNSIPTELGRFQVAGRLETIDESQWFVAKDNSLEREVWIHVQPSSAASVSEERRNCVRRTRMRLIESGTIDNQRWDAYLAPQGIPLNECLQQGKKIPWPIARSLFHQLLKEEQIVGEDRINQDQWSLSRIWIDEIGRITFSDAAIIEEKNEEPPSFQHLIAQVALVSLPQSHRKRRANSLVGNSRLQERHSVSDLAPYRGMKLLEKILAPPKGQRLDATQFEKDLKQLDESPSVVNAPTRFTHAAIVLLLLFPFFVFGFAFLAIESVIITSNIQKDTRQLATLAAIAEKPEDYRVFLAKSESAKRDELLNTIGSERIHRAFKESSRRSRTAYNNVGSFERLVLKQTNGDEDYTAIPVPIQLADRDQHNTNQQPERLDIPSSNEPGGNGNETKTARFPLPGSKMSIRWDEELRNNTTLNSMAQALKRAESGNQVPEAAENFPTLQLIGYPLLFFIVWTTIWRGGLTPYFTGVAIVRRDGCRIGFFRMFFRTCLLFLPFIILPILIQTMDLQGADSFWYSNQLKRLFVILPFAYLAATVVWPQVGPHDKVCRTAMVPR